MNASSSENPVPAEAGTSKAQNGGPNGQNLLSIDPPRYKPIVVQQIDKVPELQSLPDDIRFSMKVVGHVLPFRTNRYMVENLIDWDNVPEDPLFQLSFPQEGMISKEDFDCVADLLRRDAPKEQLNAAIHEIRAGLNPHPAGQQTLNVPTLDDEHLEGMQHKYHETVLFFPGQGQTCHAYCTFCFRWAQFVGRQGASLHLHGCGHPASVSRRAQGGDGRPLHRRGSDDHEDQGARELYAAPAG